MRARGGDAAGPASCPSWIAACPPSLRRQSLGGVFPRDTFGNAHLEFVTASAYLVGRARACRFHAFKRALSSLWLLHPAMQTNCDGSQPDATQALAPALFFTVSLLNSTLTGTTQALIKDYVNVIKRTVPGCKVLTDVMEEHVSTPGYSRQVLINTRVTDAPAASLLKLRQVVKVCPTWHSMAK